MKKLVVFLSMLLLLSGCIVIREQYTEKQIRVRPVRQMVSVYSPYVTGVYGWYNPYWVCNWYRHYYPYSYYGYYRGYYDYYTGYSRGSYNGHKGKSNIRRTVTKGSLQKPVKRAVRTPERTINRGSLTKSRAKTTNTTKRTVERKKIKKK